MIFYEYTSICKQFPLFCGLYVPYLDSSASRFRSLIAAYITLSFTAIWLSSAILSKDPLASVAAHKHWNNHFNIYLQLLLNVNVGAPREPDAFVNWFYCYISFVNVYRQ